MIRKAVRQQLEYLKRNLEYIDEIVNKHPNWLKQVLRRYRAQCFEVIRILLFQQQYNTLAVQEKALLLRIQ